MGLGSRAEAGKHLGGFCKDLVGGDGGSDQDGSSEGDEKGTDSGCTVNIEPTGFAERPGARVRQRNPD